jgi:fructosamine-3-kinase
MEDLARRLTAILGRTPQRIETLGGGCVGDVRRARFADGEDVVVKVGNGRAPGLALEGKMLVHLAVHSMIPVPRVFHADDDLLVMQYITGGDRLTRAAQEDAADHLAALHAITAPTFGLAYDTVIGGLHQPNTQTKSWLEFFRNRRVLAMGGEALTAGRLPAQLFHRLEKLCGQLSRWIQGASKPSLIHGDLWGGNIIVAQDRLAAVIDPAISFADAEIELAFSTLFSTFGDAFFARYNDLRPIASGFFEERRDLYNLYPLLVHVRLFGGSYVGDVERTLKRFGF